MKKIFLTGFIVSALFVSCEKNDDTGGTGEKTISMGNDHAKDVYYSFLDGEIAGN